MVSDVEQMPGDGATVIMDWKVHMTDTHYINSCHILSRWPAFDEMLNLQTPLRQVGTNTEGAASTLSSVLIGSLQLFFFIINTECVE